MYLPCISQVLVESPALYTRSRADSALELALGFAAEAAAANEAQRQERLKIGDPLASGLPPEYVEGEQRMLSMLPSSPFISLRLPSSPFVHAGTSRASR